MKNYLIIAIFTLFAEICVGTIIIYQHPPHPMHQQPAPIPVPEIQHFPKPSDPKPSSGNSSDPKPNNGTSDPNSNPQPQSPPVQRSLQPQPHSQPGPPQWRPPAPFQHPYYGGGMQPYSYGNQPQVQFIPLGAALFGGKRKK